MRRKNCPCINEREPFSFLPFGKFTYRRAPKLCVFYQVCSVYAVFSSAKSSKEHKLVAKFQNRGSRGLNWDSDVIGPNTKVARRTWFQPLRSSYHFATLVEAKNNHYRFREPSNFLANNVRK